MGANFYNAPGFHHGDMVRIADRAEPMGDHKVERVSFFDLCGFCGSDDIEPIEYDEEL